MTQLLDIEPGAYRAGRARPAHTLPALQELYQSPVRENAAALTQLQFAGDREVLEYFWTVELQGSQLARARAREIPSPRRMLTTAPQLSADRDLSLSLMNREVAALSRVSRMYWSFLGVLAFVWGGLTVQAFSSPTPLLAPLEAIFGAGILVVLMVTNNRLGGISRNRRPEQS